MSKAIQKKAIHWPTLNTVIMVEKVFKNIDGSVIGVAELPKQVDVEMDAVMIL